MASPALNFLKNRYVLIAAAVVLIAVVAVGAAIPGAREEKRDLRVLGIDLPGTGPLVGAYERGEGPSTGKAGSDGKLQPANGKGEDGSSSEATGTDGKSEDGSGDKDGSKDSDSGSETAKAEMKVKILLWNDTLDKPMKGLTIGFPNQKEWKPDTTGKRASAVLGPIPFDKQTVLNIYPDGPSGTKVAVELIVDRRMLEASERDAVHVEINDTNVRVLGNPVDNFDRSWPRF